MNRPHKEKRAEQQSRRAAMVEMVARTPRGGNYLYGDEKAGQIAVNETGNRNSDG